MVTRRTVLKGLAGLAAGTVGLAGYAFGIEPMWRLRTQHYAFDPVGWPRDLRLRVAVIADVHAGEPYMPVSRIRSIVATANALRPDVHLLLGDYAAGHRWQTRRVPTDEWAAALSGLRAPLGAHAVLGNHDWWDDQAAQQSGQGPVAGRSSLEKQGIPVYENDVVRLTKGGRPFWLAGLGDQLALFPRARRRDLFPKSAPWDRPQIDREVATAGVRGPSPQGDRSYRRRGVIGVDDLPGTLAKITDDAPVILLAHEPDVFPEVPDRVAVTISGHTHGGQVRLLGYSPVVPSRYANRYAYGRIVEGRRNLIVSGGLGCSILPVRLGVPPEIVILELGGTGQS